MNAVSSWNGRISRLETLILEVSVSESGKYYRNGEIWTLILAVDFRMVLRFRIKKVAGTSVDEFNSFLRDDVLVNVPTSGPRRTIILEYFNLHFDNLGYNPIVNADHRVLCRPPYSQSNMALLNSYSGKSRSNSRKRLYDIKNDNELVDVMTTTIKNLTGLDATFVHCGRDVVTRIVHSDCILTSLVLVFLLKLYLTGCYQTEIYVYQNTYFLLSYHTQGDVVTGGVCRGE